MRKAAEVKAPPRAKRRLDPSQDIAIGSVAEMRALLTKYGPTLTVRALHSALRQAEIEAPMDVAEGTRLAEMQRQHDEESYLANLQRIDKHTRHGSRKDAQA